MSIEKLAAILSPASDVTPGAPPAAPRLTRAVVMTLNSDGSLGVKVDGATTSVHADALDSYVPVVGDIVELVQFGTRQLVLGQLASRSQGWTNITFESGGNWSQLAGWPIAQYRVVGNEVILRGVITGGTFGAPGTGITYLPAPAGSHIFNQQSVLGAVRVDVTGAGHLYPNSGSGGGAGYWLSLDGIRYFLD